MFLTVLGVIWKVAVIAVPLLITYFGSKKTTTDRNTMLLGLAELAWKAVEYWKATQKGTVSPETSEAAFMTNLVKVAKAAGKSITPSEEKMLREWAKVRCQAAKHSVATK